MKIIKPKGPIVCHQSDIDNPIYIPPDKKFKYWRENPAGRTKTASIKVTYVNFPNDDLAKKAFQYAVDIWETQLTSSVPIFIRAQWAPLATGVMGQAIWGSAVMNFDGAQHLNTYYPIALAEKIAGDDLNPVNEPDIVVTLNSSASWYYGFGGGPSVAQMDMITVVLHELAHGLGFTDTYSVEDRQGSVGLNDDDSMAPFIYDLFVEADDGARLFRNFDSPSILLGDYLTNGNLSYFSASAITSSGTRPRVFAPSTFNNGSSISHLDEATYSGSTNPNRLMTPKIDFQEQIHTVGPIAQQMLSDMGWGFTRIIHTPLTDTEIKNGQPYPIAVRINSDSDYDPSTVKLHYSTNGSPFTTVTMTPTLYYNEFASTLPGTTVDLSYRYFISVKDVHDREFTLPGKIQAQGKDPIQHTVTIHVGPDHEAPEIIHTSVDFVSEDDTELLLNAIVTDNISVNKVYVEYTTNGGELQTSVMIRGSGDYKNYFSSTLTLPTSLAVGDELQYRIVAVDGSSNLNKEHVPQTDFFNVFVTGIMQPRDFYANDFSSPTNHFFGNGISISTPSEFENPAIHSDHPYKDGSGVNDESNYIYQLQIPIRLNKANPYIRFDEIVLVEPGEMGSIFGGYGFFDYVVVEGSADRGVTWVPFANGYDARAGSEWLTRYNSEIHGNNSIALGDPSLFRQRTINMLENDEFHHGDEVLIRFRLFADKAVHGWGWAIDNLYIQDPVTGNESPLTSLVALYPNPVRKELTIELPAFQGETRIQIITAHGEEELDIKAENEILTIDTTPFKSGLYILKIRLYNRTAIYKFVKLDD